MRSPKQKRGARGRELDPLLARAIARLNAHLADPTCPVSQPELAARSGVDQGSISRILAGKRPEVSFYKLARMVRAAGLSLDWVIQDPPTAQNDLVPWPLPVAPQR
jgi:hypothetical protein